MLDIKKTDQPVEPVLESGTASWIKQVMRSRMGLWFIAAISFFEAALPVPLITDPFVVAGILADRSRAAKIVLVVTVTSVLGGLAAFAMAAFFFDVVVEYMSSDVQTEFQSMLSFGLSDTLVTTITGAITPVPYTITAWVVAVAGGSIWLFLLGSILGRGLRYCIVGYCTYRFGPAALGYARSSLAITSLVVLIFIVLYVVYKL